MTTRFSSKDPGETVRVGFNFKAPVANPEVTVTVRVGEDPSPAAILSGEPIVSGNWVYHYIVAGEDGVDYELDCWGDVDGQRLLIDAILPVRARPAA